MDLFLTKYKIGFFIILVTSMGCNPFVDEYDSGIGPCVHNYKEPILTIASIADQLSGAQIDSVFISSITTNGFDQDFKTIEKMANISMTQDSSLKCITPFALGFEAGDYHITISAIGYSDSLFSIHAEYETFEGGCPSFSDDGTHIELTLMPL